MRKTRLAALLLLSVAAALCVGTACASGTTAAPTNDSLLCDGVLQTPTVYKINGSNYFKIRDLAAILNGSDKQFAVGYDAEKQSVTADTGAGYTKLSTDLTGAPAGGNKNASPSNDAIYINGALCQAEVYKIDGMNYFKLRDLGQALDFYVGWDGNTNTVALDTSKGYGEESISDNSQAAMARAMLDVLNREIGAYGSARLIDADGDGVKELIVMNDFSTRLYDWNGGQLSVKEIGAVAGGQTEWWLCRNTATGEIGVEYHTVGGSYDNSTIFYPTREVSLNYTYSDDDSSDFCSYSIDGQEVFQVEYNHIRGQNRHLEYLLSDMNAGELEPIIEIQAELECLAAGKTTRDISDEVLLMIAQRLEYEVSSMDISIMNGWPTECDYNDFILVDMGGGPIEHYRVIGYTDVADVIKTVEELWSRKVSRSDPTFELSFTQQIQDRYVARNGALYRHDLGMGDGGIVGLIDKIVSRTDDRVIFSGYSTYDGTENLGDFQISLVYEDGTWKYCSMYGAPDAYQ